MSELKDYCVSIESRHYIKAADEEAAKTAALSSVCNHPYSGKLIGGLNWAEVLHGRGFASLAAAEVVSITEDSHGGPSNG